MALSREAAARRIVLARGTHEHLRGPVARDIAGPRYPLRVAAAELGVRGVETLDRLAGRAVHHPDRAAGKPVSSGHVLVGGADGDVRLAVAAYIAD